MSQQFDNTNRFTLFHNAEKKNDRGPDFSGTLNVDGVEFFIDAWEKTAQSGRVFFSGSIKLKTQQAPARSAPAKSVPPRRSPPPAGYGGSRQTAPASGFDDMDDDIPF